VQLRVDREARLVAQLGWRIRMIVIVASANMLAATASRLVKRPS